MGSHELCHDHKRGAGASDMHDCHRPKGHRGPHRCGVIVEGTWRRCKEKWMQAPSVLPTETQLPLPFPPR